MSSGPAWWWPSGRWPRVPCSGSAFRLSRHRGEVLGWPPAAGTFADSRLPIAGVVATNHPSAVLRAQGADRATMYDALVSDLRLAAAQ